MVHTWKIGDKVRFGFSLRGEISRFERRGNVLGAVVVTGELYTRWCPLTDLTRIES